MIGSRFARRTMLVLAGLAIAEWIASAWSYRTRVAQEDWDAVRAAVSQLPDDEPVFLATPWLGPRARMQIPALRRPEVAAPPDLRGYGRFHVLGMGRDDWSRELTQDLAGLPRPHHQGSDDLGALELHHYASAHAAPLISQLTKLGPDLDVATAQPCSGGPERWKCKEGVVELRAVEVDYRPRQCFAVSVTDGVSVRLSAKNVALGDIVRGHLGFDDFNRRLRSDAPVELTLRLDGDVAGRWVVTDEQGWWPFAVATTPGSHDISLEVRPALRGTWWRQGYITERPLVPCVELRSFTEGAG